MRILFTFLLTILLICTVEANAGVYKYTDADGKVRYTDDLTLVPEDQRAQYGGEEEYPTPRPSDESGEAETAEPGEGGTEAGDAADQNDREEYDRLSKIQEELKETYETLEKEHEDLKAEKAGITTKKEQDAYNTRAKELNEKVAAYEERVRQFNDDKKKYTNRPEEESAAEE